MSKYHVLKMPTSYIRDAIAQVRKCAEVWDSVDAERADLPRTEAEALKRYGEVGIDEWRQKIAQGEQEKAQAAQSARTEIARLRGCFEADVDAQTVPSGADTSDPDYALFRDGLISSEEQLEKVMSQHEDSATFRAVASAYAHSHKWADFGGYVDNESAVRGYGQAIFDCCENGAENPRSYDGMRAMFDGEPQRVADAFDVRQEYERGGQNDGE